MKHRTIKSLIICIFSAMPLLAYSADDMNQPGSDLAEGTETFNITCAGMPQETTIDISECFGKKLAEVKWVKNKYLTAAEDFIKTSNKDNPAYSQKLLAAFQAENGAWDTLINKSSESTVIAFDGGSGAGVGALSRTLELTQLQIHDLWKNWLRYQDSTPPVLPEPKFRSDEQ